MLPILQMWHLQDEPDDHYCGEDCGCGAVVIITDMNIFVVHAPPPDLQYPICIIEMMQRCLN